MPTRTGARRLKLRRVASPSPSPTHIHPGSSLPRKVPAPDFEGPPWCTKRPAPPLWHLDAPRTDPDQTRAPAPPPVFPTAVGLRAGPKQASRPRAGERTRRLARPHPHAGDSASRWPPGKDKGCSAAGRTVPGSPRPQPRWPPTRPALCLLCRRGLHSPDGFREEATCLRPCTLDLLPRPQGPQPLSPCLPCS